MTYKLHKSHIAMLFIAISLLVWETTKSLPYIPKDSTQISSDNCRSKIEIEPTDHFQLPAGKDSQLHLKVSLTNLGKQTWGFGGVPVALGAVWFNYNKQDFNHNPNNGEQRFKLPGPIPPGENIKFEITLNVLPGKHIVWLSPMQESVMWCFHTGDTPKKITINAYNIKQ
jgi:hypothetical protein